MFFFNFFSDACDKKISFLHYWRHLEISVMVIAFKKLEVCVTWLFLRHTVCSRCENLAICGDIDISFKKGKNSRKLPGLASTIVYYNDQLL